jgi:hypothetical protein
LPLARIARSAAVNCRNSNTGDPRKAKASSSFLEKNQKTFESKKVKGSKWSGHVPAGGPGGKFRERDGLGDTWLAKCIDRLVNAG